MGKVASMGFFSIEIESGFAIEIEGKGNDTWPLIMTRGAIPVDI